MNKTWLIFQREFLNRVKKRSFLIATIVVPLIFPAILAVMIYAFIVQEQSAKAPTIEVYDESGKMNFEADTSRFKFIAMSGSFEQVKKSFQESDHYALLRIPPFQLSKPEGITLYTKENPSIRRRDELEALLEDKVHDLKLEQFNIDKETLKNLRTEVTLNNINVNDKGEEQESNTGFLYGLGFALGILIYLFVIIYGMQIMLGVIDEKTSKVVEIIISSVKPFQLMMGKILGIAAVGLLQVFIWVLLITVFSSATVALLGVDVPEQQAMEEISRQVQGADGAGAVSMQETNAVIKLIQYANEIPVGYIVFNFAFYFLGGYLLYGALFAAVGSAVESQQEAQQFTLPIMMPLMISYLALVLFILHDPHSPASFWFSIIPFTSPIAMVGRLGFGVPLWQLLLSQGLLVLGFFFTTWVAARIYRIGILMHGSKVNYRVLAKWFLMKA
jgi:ABC-2 type transport system permease protein